MSDEGLKRVYGSSRALFTNGRRHAYWAISKLRLGDRPVLLSDQGRQHQMEQYRQRLSANAVTPARASYSALVLPGSESAMDNVLHALQGIGQPALAADSSGHALASNDAFDRLMPRGIDAMHAAWLNCLGDGGQAEWQRGTSLGHAFIGRLARGSTAGPRSYRATPILSDPGGARWLVTLSANGSDEQDDQLVRLSLGAAVRASHIGLWDWNPESDSSIWSPELYDIYRLPRGNGIEPGARFLAMLHPDDRSKVDEAVAASAGKGGIDPYVFRLKAGDGSWRWIMTCAQVAQHPGQALARLVGVNIDVTDTLESQTQLDAERQQRARHEQITKAVMDNAPVGIAVALNGEAGLAYVSHFGAAMVKATPEHARSWAAWQLRRRPDLAAVPETELPLYRAARGDVVREEEWLLQATDGSLIPISCDAGPIYDTTGAVIGGAVVWHDVTGYKSAQRDRELFLASVSHELRTPLSAIQGWSEILRRSTEPSVLERGIDAISRNAATQARLVEDLIDVTRIAAGKVSMKLVVEDLTQIVRTAVNSVQPMAMTAQVAVDFSGNAQLIVMADEQRLRQAICNLLTNAVKFSRPGGLVEVVLEAKAEEAKLRVIDHGLGIDAEHLEQVFDQFWQREGKVSSRSGGLGLGLTIARHIVDGHGGTLAVHSAGAGLGSTFTVTLPARGAAER